tara:strand:+ start:605 stop:733 length:129 start_codon:yes stop_codon:yes gene_type:complete
MVFITKTGWTYTEIFQFPIKKRNWLLEMYKEMIEEDKPEQED